MDARQLNLDCDEPTPGEWRVVCTNTGLVLSQGQRTAEAAWAVAANRLVSCLNDIRRSVCNIE